MSADPMFDRWYAAKSARFLHMPTNRLETFGNTIVDYHLVSELEDVPGKTRVREGRLEAHRPLVITPDFSGIKTEGFSEAAVEYLEFLRRNEEHLRILQYGFHLKSDNFSEQILSEPLQTVAEKVLAEVKAKDTGFSAVVVGLDDPWDVALVELWRREVDRSAMKNIRDLDDSGELFKKG